MRVLVLALIVIVTLAACGSDEPAATTSTNTAAMSTTSAIPVETTTTETPASSTTSTTVVLTTTAVQQIDVEFHDGQVTGPEVIPVELGDEVDVWVLSDVDDELHVHGYDLYYDLVAGQPFQLSFVADVPGIFEVEVHTGHTPLFELEVSG